MIVELSEKQRDLIVRFLVSHHSKQMSCRKLLSDKEIDDFKTLESVVYILNKHS